MLSWASGFRLAHIGVDWTLADQGADVLEDRVSPDDADVHEDESFDQKADLGFSFTNTHCNSPFDSTSCFLAALYTVDCNPCASLAI